MENNINPELYYVLTEVSDWKESKITAPFITAKFRDLNGKHFSVYIVSGNRNIKNWGQVINCEWGIYSGMKLVEHDIIDADCKPKLEQRITESEALSYKIHGDFDTPVGGGTFQDLFDGD